MRELREGPGKDIALFGGASLFRSLLDADAGQVDTEVSHPGAARRRRAADDARLSGVPPRLVKQGVLPATGTLSLEYAILGRHSPAG